MENVGAIRRMICSLKGYSHFITSTSAASRREGGDGRAGAENGEMAAQAQLSPLISIGFQNTAGLLGVFPFGQRTS